jgi:hypothetical protein
MGNFLSACLGYMIIYYIKVSEKVQEMIKGKKETPKGKYYSNEIVLRDDEKPAGE